MRTEKLLKSIISSLLLQIVIAICGFIVPNFIIKHYGSNMNGLIVSITQFLSYISLFEAGVGPVIKLMLYKPIANNDKDMICNLLKTSEKFFNKVAKIFLLYIVALIIIYPFLIESNFDFSLTSSLIIIISISTIAEYFFGITYMLFLQANQESYIVSYAQMLVRVLSTIITIVLIKFNHNIVFVKLCAALILVLKPIIQNYYVRKKYKLDCKNGSIIEIQQKSDAFAQHIAYTIHMNTDTMVLTTFSSIINVSIYSIYLLIINGIRNIIGSLCSGLEAGFGDMIAKNEWGNLKRRFLDYQIIYFIILTIIFCCTIVLTIPFIEVYTRGITDANYIQYELAILLILSEIIYSIRRPFNSLILAAGKFKETKNGAWVEAIVNIVVSSILVIKFGLIGVAIGTIIAMLIRTVELIIFLHNNVIEFSYKDLIKKLVIMFVVIFVVYILSYCIKNKWNFEIVGYIQWFKYAIFTFIMSSIFTVGINLIFNFRELMKCLRYYKNKFLNKGEV